MDGMIEKGESSVTRCRAHGVHEKALSQAATSDRLEEEGMPPWCFNLNLDALDVLDAAALKQIKCVLSKPQLGSCPEKYFATDAHKNSR